MSGEEAPAETETERETERETEGTSGSQEAAVDKNEGDTTQNVQTKEEENAGSYSTLCRDMFGKIAEYINGELAATSEEYQLLQRLNQMTLNKYQDMTALASRLNDVSQRLNDKFVSLQPYCDQIDKVEASVSALEQTAYRLDAYCKRLESKYRDLEKR